MEDEGQGSAVTVLRLHPHWVFISWWRDSLCSVFLNHKIRLKVQILEIPDHTPPLHPGFPLSLPASLEWECPFLSWNLLLSESRCPDSISPLRSPWKFHTDTTMTTGRQDVGMTTDRHRTKHNRSIRHRAVKASQSVTGERIKERFHVRIEPQPSGASDLNGEQKYGKLSSHPELRVRLWALGL